MDGRSLVLAFPGQGSEEPGMGVARAARSARAGRLFGIASDLVGHDVARALERGGKILARTDVLQPVLVAVSLGAAYELEDRSVRPDVVLGHSLGELTAAIVATGLDDERAIELAVLRGRLMHEAALASPGGMCALVGEPDALAAAVAVAIDEGCVLAAENAPDERVVSGSAAAVRRVLTRAGPMARPLRTVGPWHSPAMAPAASAFRPAVERALEGRALRARLVSAVGPAEPPLAGIADVLARGLVEPVRFVAALALARDAGATRLHAVEPSRTLRSLVRRAAPELARDDDPEPRDAGRPW